MKKELFCGIDVSKDKLDICFLSSNSTFKPKYQTLPNEINLIKAYFEPFMQDELLVVFEPTSNYHILLQQALSALGIKYSMPNPAKSSLFLRHLNTIKTDSSDSYGLAVYARTFKSDINPSKYNAEYIQIKSYNSAVSLLIKLQTQLKNFKHSQGFLKDTNLNEIIENLINEIRKQAKILKDLAFNILKNFLPQTEQIIKDSKGIGEDLALNLFPQLHFNKDKSEKQIISFLGLSPKIYQSGSSINKPLHITKRGNPNIRKSLFMSALVCIRRNDRFRARYESLVNKGKSKKVAIVAVMCAIVRYLKSFFRFEPAGVISA